MASGTVRLGLAEFAVLLRALRRIHDPPNSHWNMHWVVIAIP